MGLFSGVENASVSGGGVYFLPGLYRVNLEKVFTMRSRKGDDLFIAECKILESDNEQRSVGSHASWVVNFRFDAAMGNIKGFVAAANGMDPSDEAAVKENITEEACEYAVSDDNPLEGIELNLEATNIITRNNTDFTLHAWSPVDEG